jgi:DUF4097 and DUF4098 domain-containing protein YvlB
MRIFIRSWIALFVVAVCAVVVADDRQVNQTMDAEPDGTVSIELVTGSVRFIGWNRNEIQIEGTLAADVEGLEIDISGGHVSIEVELVHRPGGIHHADADLEIHVPAGSRIDAESVSADLEVEGIHGAVSIESVNGEIRIRGNVTEADIATVSSNIYVESGSGLRDGQFQTVSGSIEFEGALDPSGRFDFEVVSGDVTLRLPGNTSADFDVETFSGDIDNQLGPAAQQTSKYVPSKSLRFSTGSGGARVSIESFSGRVRLLPR